MMRNKPFPNYPDDADYTTNAPSYYDDLARKQKLIQLLAKKIWEYENTLNETLEQIEQRLTDYILENDLLMNERLENWDQRIEEMPEEMQSLFVTWLNDGTLEQIINHDVLGNKADQSELDITNAQLEHTTHDVQSKAINIKYPPAPLVGAKGDGTDETDIINTILQYTGTNVFEFPAGNYVANIELPRGSITLRGDNKRTTFIRSYDADKPTITTNKRLYVTIEDISIRQKYGSVKPSLDMTDSRYCTIEQVDIQQEPNDTESYSYTSDGIDMRNVTNYWVGYNRLKEVHVARCRYGINTGPDLNSVLSIVDSKIDFCGLFGVRLEGVTVGLLSNLDIAANGQLGQGLTPDEKMYGGIYIKGSHILIQGVWNEQNIDTYAGIVSPNNVYIHPDSLNVSYYAERGSRGLDGSKIFSEDMGVNQNMHLSDRPVDDGMGREKSNNVVVNGCFKHWLNGRPMGWRGYFADTILTKEVDDLPAGFTEGYRVVNEGTGITGIYQQIYDANNTDGVISDISKHVGKYITVTMWVKNINAPIGPLRAGIDTGTGGFYFSTGSYHSAFPENKWLKIVLTRKITGTEDRLAIGVRTAGEGRSFIVTGIACSLSPRVGDSESKTITEDGGIMFNDLEFPKNEKSIVLTAPNNSKYRISVSDSGELTTTLV